MCIFSQDLPGKFAKLQSNNACEIFLTDREVDVDFQTQVLEPLNLHSYTDWMRLVTNKYSSCVLFSIL